MAHGPVCQAQVRATNGRCILTPVRRVNSIWRLSFFIQDAHPVSDEMLPGFCLRLTVTGRDKVHDAADRTMVNF
jgi:hypothetical protein